jgi:hypothetical protein
VKALVLLLLLLSQQAVDEYCRMSAIDSVSMPQN